MRQIAIKDHEEESLKDSTEYLVILLQALNDGQMDRLLSLLQSIEKDETLIYLLKKNNQWTNLSQVLISNSNNDTKDSQIRRLLTLQDNSFKPDNENDATLV